jgi:type I restriction enzyme, S subunit
MKNGWQTKTLSDLFDITSSKRVFEADWKTEGVPFYRAREIVKLARHGFVENELFISEEMFDRYSTKYGIPVEGDIMVTGVGTLGICYVVKKDDRFYFKDGNIIWLKKKTEADSRFVEYAFQSDYLRSQIDDSVGATVGTFTIIKAKSTRIPVPALPEQQRIVGLLDEAFAGLATAKAHAEKNLQNARALFESYLQSVFAQRGKGWVETTLGEAFDVRDGTHDSPKFHATGHPLITSKNLKREGLSFDDVKLISEQDYAKINERSAVHKGDVLFAMIGTIGNPTLVEVEPNFAIKNVALFKNPHGQSGAFLKHYLDSGWVISKMMKEAKGTTQKFVGLGYLRGFPINLPPVATQLKIVEELDELAEETQRLATIYEQKLAAVEALKKSLLHQAFTGQL